MNVVMATEKRDVIKDLQMYLLEQYQFYHSARIGDKNIILEQLITILHTTMLAMSKFHIPPTDLDKFIKLIDIHIREQGVEAEGINLICACATCYKR